MATCYRRWYVLHSLATAAGASTLIFLLWKQGSLTKLRKTSFGYVISLYPYIALLISHHRPQQDYIIPKGASVIGNVWSVGRDPVVFPDPETFNPQRWINEDGMIREELKSFTFGFGRR